MKKFTTTILLSIYLLSATEAHQFLKLPVIFYHFAEHKTTNRTISFIDFLAIHYLHGTPRDKDNDRDMQLPFKTCVNINNTLPAAPVPHLVQLPSIKELAVKTKRVNPKNLFILSSHSTDIWQPPKFS